MEKFLNNDLKENFPSKENSLEKDVLIILRFSTSGRVYSFRIPNTWKVNKLEDFIASYMKEEINNSNFTLFFGAKKLDDHREKLSDILKPGINTLNNIIVSIQKNTQSENVDANKNFTVRIFLI
jgi:hypothetical protein